MTALTLAMNEVQGVNSDEFLAVRAYHSLGASFRHALYSDDRNLLSPTSSVSSGVESYATSESERISKDSGNDSSSESEQKCKDNSEHNSLAIMYEGRNILDLGNNIKPFTWQLSSFTQLSTPGFYFFKTSTVSAKTWCSNDSIRESAQELCGNCSFSAPVVQPTLAVRR